MAKMEITLFVNNDQIDFAVDLPDYNRYVNELTPYNKVAPARNFLMRCVTSETKETLRKVVDLPGVGVQLASSLLDEYMPDVNITVGK